MIQLFSKDRAALFEPQIDRELIKLGVTEVELMWVGNKREMQLLIARKIYNAAFNAAVRPWREVLATDTE